MKTSLHCVIIFSFFLLITRETDAIDIHISTQAVYPPPSIFNGDLLLSLQSEIDNFNYSSVTGTLTIREQVPGNITNLNGLSVLVSAGNLVIENNSALSHLDGLINLKSIEYTKKDGNLVYTSPGALIINNNSSLLNIAGLTNISFVSLLSISNNDNLININGLSGVVGIAENYWIYSRPGPVTITDNDKLLNVDGLSGIGQLGSLTIINNQDLNDINGLENLGVVGFLYEGWEPGPLTIEQNVSLFNFCSLYTLLTSYYDLQIPFYGDISIRSNGANPTISEIVQSGPCPAIYLGDLVLTSQVQVDDFSYVSVTGSLTIREILPGNITNLNGLSVLTSAGNLNIENNSALADLNGLSNLQSLEYEVEDQPRNYKTTGTLTIKNNPSLKNINGLAGLTSVRGLHIENNDALPDLDGLTNLVSIKYYLVNFPVTVYIPGAVNILDNNVLINIDGLSKIKEVGSLIIRNNNLLVNIEGLSSLSVVGLIYEGFEPGFLIIEQNISLSEFCPLYTLLKGEYYGTFSIQLNGSNPTVQEIIDSGPCLQSFTGNLILASQSEIDRFRYYEVTGSLEIAEAVPGGITNLNGLSVLKSVGDLLIRNNNVLLDLQGLSNLTFIGNIEAFEIEEGEFWNMYNGGQLYIINNTALKNVNGLSNVWLAGDIVVESNPALTNLIGLSNLTRLCHLFFGGGCDPGLLQIVNNISLKEFCGLYPLLKNLGWQPGFTIAGNAVNPGGEEILNSGPCPTFFQGDLTLTSQAEVDNFNYYEVRGTLLIKETVPGTIINLNGLSELVRVGEGWPNSPYIGSLIISDNSALINVDGLLNFKLADEVKIINNDALTNIDGLSGFLSFGVELNISENNSLVNIDGLSGLTHYEGVLVIKINSALVQFCGLYNVLKAGIHEALVISGNAFNPTAEDIINKGSCASRILVNAMSGTFTGDARLGTMRGSINPRAVYFQGLKAGLSFNVDIPQSSKNWYAWARMYYMSSGGKNSFQLTFDNMKYVLGDNDNMYNQWHWDGNDGSRINLGVLTSGQHKLVLSGREPGLTLWIDQLVLTDDPDFVPEGFTPTISNITLNAMQGKFTGDARLGTMRGSINPRAVYFQGINGGVSFNINIPLSKRHWSAWGRMYYMSSAGKNSFYITAAGQKHVLGDNDSKYNQWHWDGSNGGKIDLGILAPGEHTIMISGREPGLTLWIDQLILTDDPEFIPEGFSYTSNKIFINAMNGTFTGDARLGTMTGSMNTRSVYFQGLNGGVSFNVNFPSSQKDWYVWGRMYYMSSGGKNSFYVSADGIRYVLGDNDSRYNQWHWDGNKGARINLGTLAAGNHTIIVSGREPGLTLWVDQLLLTDDANYNPPEVLVKSSSDADSLEISIQKPVPSQYELSQNYPNPFNSRTIIRFALPAISNVSIEIHNEIGQMVRKLAGGIYEEGYHDIEWDSRNDSGGSLPSGIYFYRISVYNHENNFTKVNKMVLLK